MAQARADTTVAVRRKASGASGNRSAAQKGSTRAGPASGRSRAGRAVSSGARGPGPGAAAARRAAAGAKSRPQRAAANRRRSVLQPGETPRTRGERTRRRVADALIDLIGEGDLSPTAKAVAERAGVSVRLVFHHFEDMDALYRLALEVQDARSWADVREVAADPPLDQRVDRTVRQRAKLFESIGPLRHALLPIAPRSSSIADALAQQDRRLRGSLETTFAPELRRSGRTKRDLLDALDASASWEMWDRLRRQGLGPAPARRVMGRTVASLVGR